MPDEKTLQTSDEPLPMTQIDAVELTVDAQAQKRLLRKLDIYLAPVMTIIFLMAYLDRSNIGNAASAGMLDDIHMSSAQLGSMSPQIASMASAWSSKRAKYRCADAVTLFYVTYVTFEVPCSLLLKKLRPSKFDLSLSGS